MCLDEALRNLDRDVERLGRTQRAAPDEVVERFAFIVGESQEDAAVGRRVNLVNGADVGVVEGGSGLRFLNESLPRIVVEGELLGKKLERDGPV